MHALLVTIGLIIGLTSTCFAEVLPYEYFSVKSLPAHSIGRARTQAFIEVKNAVQAAPKDLWETAAFAAKDILKKNKSDVVVIRIYSDEGMTYWPQIFDLTYAPDRRGWSGNLSPLMETNIASPMPSADTLRIAKLWVKINKKRHLTISETSKIVADKLGVPVDSVEFPSWRRTAYHPE